MFNQLIIILILLCTAEIHADTVMSFDKINEQIKSINNLSVQVQNEACIQESFVNCEHIVYQGTYRVDSDVDGNEKGLSFNEVTKIVTLESKSSYKSFENISFLESFKPVMNCFEKIGFRYNPQDRCPAQHIKKVIKEGLIDKQTAIVMDSGGPHSVAMAAEISKIRSHQVVFSYRDTDWKSPDKSQKIGITEYLSAIRFHSPTFRDNRAFEVTAPPLVVLDIHRQYQFQKNDLPDGNKMKQDGIKKIIWVVEADTQYGLIPLSKDAFKIKTFDGNNLSALNDVNYTNMYNLLENYKKDGIEVYLLKISPYDCPEVKSPVQYGW